MVPRTMGATNGNVEFLRKVVAPVEVPGQKQKEEANNNRRRKLTRAELKEEHKKIKKRRAERKARAKANGERVIPEKLEKMPEAHVKRELSWFSSSGSNQAYSESFLADPSVEYDKWAQAYRFLGGYIDCDHNWDGDDHHSGSNDNGNNDDGDQNACSRWMIYATYINPNYQGYEYSEYFSEEGESPPSALDCHLPDSEWQLLGVFRQEHYQYIEQISKHLWAIDEEEYVVALAGLAYMTDYECYGVGNDGGDYLYVGVKPVAGGDTELALYTDNQCLVEDSDSGLTPSSFGLQNELNLGSKDGESDHSYAYDYWYDAQEDTLTDMNTVYQSFKYCTTCVDYPTYQDGYFIGDYGTDDDDLINQCWKFWSHDAYICENDCLSKASAQGTILQINYGDYSYGHTDSSFYQQSAVVAESSGNKKSSADLESPLARLLANAFLTLTFLLFVATFLAFAVARRSRYRESRSSRSRRLLDEDHQSRRSASQRRRSKSRDTRSKSNTEDRDGLFRDGSRRTRARSSRSRASSRRPKNYDPEE